MDGEVLVFSASTPGSVWVQVGLNKQMELRWLCQVFLHFLQHVSATHCWIFNHCQNVMASLCFDKTECSWLLQYVWVEKEQTLIISSAQRGSRRSSCFIRGYRLFVKPFNVPDNQPPYRRADNYFLSSFFFLLLFSVKSKRGGRSGITIILSTIQSIQVCCTGVEGEEAESWSGMAIVLTAENKGPDNSPSLTTAVGFMWIFSLGWLLSYLQQLSQSYALNLAVCCLVANELWRYLVITAAVSLSVSPPFLSLANWLKIIDWNPIIMRIGCVLRQPLPLSLSLSFAFSCYLFGTATVTNLRRLLEHAHRCPPPPPPLLLIFSQWVTDKDLAKDVMHLFEVSSVSEAHAIHIGRGWKRWKEWLNCHYVVCPTWDR